MNNVDETKKAELKKSKKQRSPGFPVIPLEEAISKIKIIYQHDKRAFTTPEVIVAHLGYKSLRGGSAARALAALRYFKLLEEKSGQFRVSELGFKLLHLPEDSSEKKEIIKELSLTPSLFKRVFSFYEGELPSDTTLKSHLILNERFNPDSVGQFIRVLRQTIAFANPSLDDEERVDISNDNFLEEESNVSQEIKPQGTVNQTNSQPVQTSSPFPSGETLKFRISRDSEVAVIFSGQVTQEAVEKLKILLEATKDTYPTQSELEQPLNATWKNLHHDQPVKVVGNLGKAEDGRDYVKIEGSETGIPVDELDFNQN